MAMVSQAEYARRYGIDRSAVCHAIKAGRLKLVRGKVDDAVDIRATRRREPGADGGVSVSDLGTQLQQARLDKLKADTVVQKQKDRKQQVEWQNENLMALAQLLKEVIAPVRSGITGLKAPKGELDHLGDLWDAALDLFDQRVKEICANRQQ